MRVVAKPPSPASLLGRSSSEEISPLELSSSALYLRRGFTHPQNRVSKRPGTLGHSRSSSDDADAHGAHAAGAGRCKRVWKACARCRMKKTKCDGEFPCRRCKDDGSICTATTRKRGPEYKKSPPGYAEFLETTQLVLVSTIRKLYRMMQSNQNWTMGDAALNNYGQPIIHDIAKMLDCIRVTSAAELPGAAELPERSAIPESMAEMDKLARRLEKAHAHAKASHSEFGSANDDISSDTELPIPSLSEMDTLQDSWDDEANCSEPAFEQPAIALGGELLSLDTLEMDIFSKASSMLAKEKELRQLRDKFPLSPLNGYPFWSYGTQPAYEDGYHTGFAEDLVQCFGNAQAAESDAFTYNGLSML